MFQQHPLSLRQSKHIQGTLFYAPDYIYTIEATKEDPITYGKPTSNSRWVATMQQKWFHNQEWYLGVTRVIRGKKKLLANGYKVKTHYGGGGRERGGHFHNMYVMYIFAKCVTLKFGFHFWCLTFTELMILNIIWKKEINLRD